MYRTDIIWRLGNKNSLLVYTHTCEQDGCKTYRAQIPPSAPWSLSTQARHHSQQSHSPLQ
jgi:hypothetical protein